MKYYKPIGLFAGVLLIISCFLPWAYYPDINKHFTGFFSEENVYGKPAKVFIFLAVVSVALIFIDKLWAKRTLLFVATINLAYLIKSYVLFTTCYNTICPQKEYGLYLLMTSVVLLSITSIFPDMKIPEKKEKN